MVVTWSHLWSRTKQVPPRIEGPALRGRGKAPKVFLRSWSLDRGDAHRLRGDMSVPRLVHYLPERWCRQLHAPRWSNAKGTHLAPRVLRLARRALAGALWMAMPLPSFTPFCFGKALRKTASAIQRDFQRCAELACERTDASSMGFVSSLNCVGVCFRSGAPLAQWRSLSCIGRGIPMDWPWVGTTGVVA